MGFDVAKVREWYFNPRPLDDPPRIPSREEFAARYERWRVEDCLLRGGDPKAEGLGEHGSLIGGLGKPVTLFRVRPSDFLGCHPLPLAWYDYPSARLPWPPRAGREATRARFRWFSAKHLADIENRPSGTETERRFRAETLTRGEAADLARIFLCLRPRDLSWLVGGSGLSVHELARAAHNSGTRRTWVALFLSSYAIPPENLGRVPAEHWRKVCEAKEEAWAEVGLRPPWRRS